MNQRKCGAILSYLLLAVKNCTFLLFIPILVSWLGKEQFGLYNIIGSFMSSMLILDMGLSNSVVRFVAKYRARKDTIKEEAFLSTIMTTYLLFALIALIVGILLYQFIPAIFKHSLSISEIKQIQEMFVLLIINVCLTLVFNPYRGVLAAYERYIVLKTIEISQQLLRVLLIIILIMVHKSILSVVIADTLCNIAVIALRVFYANKLGRQIKYSYIDLSILKEVFVYSVFIAMNLIATELYWRTNNIVLGIMTSSSLVAVYGLGAQFSMYYSQFSYSLSQVTTSKIVMLVEKGADGKVLTDELIKTGRIQLMIISVIFLSYLFYGKKFIKLWVGPGFEESYLIGLFVMMPMSILLIQNLGITILEAKRLHWFRSITMFVMSIINIIVTIFLVKIMGIIGAAIATSIGLIIGNIIMLNIFYHKVIKLNMVRYYREVGKGILLAMAGASICVFIGKLILGNPDTWPNLILQIAIFCIVYCILLLAVGINKYERNTISGMLKNKGMPFSAYSKRIDSAI